MSTNYLGVYSTMEAATEKTSTNTEAAAPQNASAIKKFWYVWKWDTGTVVVLGANAMLRPEGQPRIITYSAFDSRFSKDDTKSSRLPEPAKPTASDLNIDQAAATKEDAAPTGSANDSEKDSAKAPTDTSLTPEKEKAVQLDIEQVEAAKPTAPNTLFDIDEEIKSAFRDPQLRTEVDLDSLEGGKTPPVLNAEDKALQKAEHTMRSVFLDGLSQFRQGYSSKAMQAFERPLQVDTPWKVRHKQMFSEFGISLRKIKIFELALRHHIKALSLSPNDVNILFNMARVHICLGDFEAAQKCLKEALYTMPKMKEAAALQRYLDKCSIKP